MAKLLYSLVSVVFCIQIAFSQERVNLLVGEFDSESLPEGWRSNKSESSKGWQFGTARALSSQGFQIPDADGSIVVSNDDACGVACDGLIDFLDTPAIAVANPIGMFLSFRSYFTGQWGQQAIVMLSEHGVEGPYFPIAELYPSDPHNSTWRDITIDLSHVMLEETTEISIRFWSSDDGNWASGWALDGIIVGYYNYSGIVPNCSSLVYPPHESNTTSLSQTLSWQYDELMMPGFPTGYFINFGTDNPPTNIVHMNNIGHETSVSTHTLEPNTTYYWQIIPFGANQENAQSCNVWSFTTSIPNPIPKMVPYFEDFENGTGGWSSEGNSSSWAYGFVSKTIIKRPFSGSKAWSTGGIGRGVHNSHEHSYLMSPPFDFSNVDTELYISMRLWWDTEDGYDGAVFQTSVDGGVTWIDVGGFDDGFQNWYDTEEIRALPEPSSGWSGFGPNNWVEAIHLLPGLEGSHLVYFRILFASDSGINFDGIAVDDIKIEAVSTSAPICAENIYPLHGETGVALQLNLEWMRSSSESTFLPLGYHVSIGTNPEADNIINSLDTLRITSFTTPELEANTTYFWKITPYGFAGVPATNCPVWNFTVSSPKATFPYFETFENGEGGWAPLGSRSSWSFGTPNKAVINGSFSGNNCWVTGRLDDHYEPNEYSYVLSPLFDFSNYTVDPVFYAMIWWETETQYDGANLQMSIEKNNWVTVGTMMDGQNWYTSAHIISEPGTSPLGWTGRYGAGSNGWVLVSHILAGAAGKKFQLRFNFASDFTISSDGFAFDDIRIIPLPESIIPPCPGLIYPADASTDIKTPFNLQWDEDLTFPGLPLGYMLMFGTSKPPQEMIDIQKGASLPVDEELLPNTTYYWQIHPYGYNDTLNEHCPVWSFTTAAKNASEMPVSSSAETPTNSTSEPKPTETVPFKTLMTSTTTDPVIQGTTDGELKPQESSSKSSHSSVKTIVISTVVGGTVLILIVVALVVLAMRRYRKRSSLQIKLQNIETELAQKEVELQRED